MDVFIQGLLQDLVLIFVFFIFFRFIVLIKSFLLLKVLSMVNLGSLLRVNIVFLLWSFNFDTLVSCIVVLQLHLTFDLGRGSLGTKFGGFENYFKGL